MVYIDFGTCRKGVRKKKWAKKDLKGLARNTRVFPCLPEEYVSIVSPGTNGDRGIKFAVLEPLGHVSIDSPVKAVILGNGLGNLRAYARELYSWHCTDDAATSAMAIIRLIDIYFLMVYLRYLFPFLLFQSCLSRTGFAVAPVAGDLIR